MKNLKSLAVAVLLAVSASASAQFTNSSTSVGSASANTDGWSTFWIQWSPNSFKIDEKNADDQSFTGLSIGYSQAFNIVQSMPLFIEAGLGVQYSFYSEDLGDYYSTDEDIKQKFSMFSAKIPVNLIYKFDLPNSSVSLMPFVGANLRYNLSAKMKWELDSYYTDESADVDLFDDKDMGKETWKRMQLGWEIGLKARLGNSFLVGLSYGGDMSEIAKKTKVGGANITVGFTF